MAKFDLGCGGSKPDGYIGLDQNQQGQTDIVCDLSKGIPLPDNYADEIRAYDFIEHIADKLFLINEIHRVSKPGCIIDISVPSTDGRGAWQDPDHKSWWNENSFYYYTALFEIISLCTTDMVLGGVCHVKAILKSIKA